MRGHKLHLRQDRLSATLLAMAKTAGIPPDPCTTDVLLGNLLGLHAVRALRDQKLKLGNTEMGGTTMVTGIDDRFSLDTDGLLDSASDLGQSGLLLGSSLDEMTHDQVRIRSQFLDKSNYDVAFNSSFDINSSFSPESLQLETWSNILTPPISPDAQKPFDDWKPSESDGKSVAVRKLFSLPQKPFPSMLEIKEAMDSVTSRISIVNPMDMSRNLRLPSIVDLHY